MTVQKDLERSEISRLRRFTDLAGKRLLEVGCGEGRLTWQYAGATPLTVGIDLDRDSLRVARVDRPYALERKVHFTCAISENLPFVKETFDIAVLAWSL